MATFDASGAVLGATLEFESRAFEEGVQLSYGIADGVAVFGSEQQVRQLATILIDNAIKHAQAPQGGGAAEVRVGLGQAGGKAALSVYNTGEGVAEGDRARIFDRFYRSDDSRSRDTGGYGLGLAIAKSIVDAHKGSIQVDGVKGEWVRFTATFPAAPAPHGHPSRAGHAGHAGRTGPPGGGYVPERSSEMVPVRTISKTP
jgi:signal transduction histidine kinase